MGRFIGLLALLSGCAGTGVLVVTGEGKDGGVDPTDAVTDVTDVVVADPGDPGPYTWTAGQTSFTIGSGFGAKNIPLLVVVPEGDGPFPVVVLIHGFQLEPEQYRSTATHLAGWGYLVVLPQMPGSLITPETHTALKDDTIALLDWIEARATQADGPLRGVADMDHVALSGHSMGGKIAFLTATADDRVDVVFGIDPVDAGPPFTFTPSEYPSVTPERMSDVKVPFLVMGETLDGTGGFGGQSCAPQDDNFTQYYTHAASPAMSVEVVGAGHMSFLDDPDCGFVCSVCQDPTTPAEAVRAVTRRTFVAFLQVALRGEDAWRPWLDGPPIDADVAAGKLVVQRKNGL